MNGFYKLQRAHFSGALWKENRPRTPFEAQLDLMQRAAYAETPVLIKGICLNLQIGEMVASIRDLAADWQWSRAKVERFLKTLTKIGDLEARTETGLTVRKVNVFGPPGYFLAARRDTGEDKPETPTRPPHIKEEPRTPELNNMKAKPSNEPPPPGAQFRHHPNEEPRTKNQERRTRNMTTPPSNAAYGAQWNRQRFATLPALRAALDQMKRNDALHLNDRTDFLDLLREILGDAYVDTWQNSWFFRWRSHPDQCRAAFNALVEDLRDPGKALRNPAGHLNDIYNRLTQAQAA